jgi:hypothetical protein
VSIRPATRDDVPAIGDIVERAYGVYVDRLGREPRPMRDDYDERVRETDVFVAEDGVGVAGVAGVIVLCELPSTC